MKLALPLIADSAGLHGLALLGVDSAQLYDLALPLNAYSALLHDLALPLIAYSARLHDLALPLIADSARLYDFSTPSYCGQCEAL
jgi:hypothetical protein